METNVKLTHLFPVAAFAIAAGAAIAGPGSLSKDGMLVDAGGMTLYTFDKDGEGVSNCDGGCAASWPPFIAKAGAVAEADFSLVMRKDGSEQWAYRGKPLYYWAGDAAPGDANGDGVGGVWHIVE